MWFSGAHFVVSPPSGHTDHPIPHPIGHAVQESLFPVGVFQGPVSIEQFQREHPGKINKILSINKFLY